ncbi:MAG: cell envelope integrity protein CreD [Lactobacillus sp.]|jgi:inner membrane protein|nr:cell envelope integrity protein CreD [Lactobacillus sp.]
MAKSAQSTSIKEKATEGLMNNIGVRLIIICILILFLGIPLSMVKSVTMSRVYLFDITKNEISSDWGGSQTIIAPLITVPIQFITEGRAYNSEKKIYEKITNVREELYIFLPENLNIKAEIFPEMRHRGIFNVLVHSTEVNISGNFEKPDLSFLKGNYKVLWNNAVISVGVNSSLIRGDIGIKFDNKNLAFTPGSKIDGINGISSNIDLSTGIDKTFDMSFSFSGSSDVSFAPLGKKNLFEVTSQWGHPIFRGAFRPDNPTITDDYFKAGWNIPYIARDYPQIIRNQSEINNIKYKMASVDLYNTMPIYKKAQRLADYGMMFITLTFIMMFLFERKLKQNLHYIQYAIVGLAISLFFLTTTSLSEYLGFGLAYAIASLIVIVMISLYTYAALKNKKAAVTSSLLMALLYGILYLMLSEADYALLIGTFILLITMSAIMWETRHLNSATDKK